MRVSATVCSIALASWLGCAPSHRMVHDGNVYFEHCYGADFEPRLTPEQREACWNAWLAHYTRHQPSHRIDYAMRRVEALQAGEPPLSLPGIAIARQRATTPQTTDFSAAGLVTLHGPRAGAEVSTILEAGAKPGNIEHGCDGTCTRFEGECLAGCPEGADRASCQSNCDRERAICLQGCY